MRLGAVAAAVDALDESALLFERVADEHGRAAEQQRATRRAARCRTVQIAVLPVELPASPAVAPSDVRVPDLAGPGWRPLAAESALGADPVWRT
ncbi:MAG: hypothetical protein JWO79_22 [Actinomycetia bacterium]|nr:hypothetical protein [Actinomycetes bacterium]